MKSIANAFALPDFGIFPQYQIKQAEVSNLFASSIHRAKTAAVADDADRADLA